jgi:hypothetical protein
MLNEASATKQFYRNEAATEGPLYLSMLVSSEAFMYAIFTENFKRPIELCHVHFEAAGIGQQQPIDQISLLLRNHYLDRKKFEKVNIAVLDQNFNLVPIAFSNEDALKPMLKFTTGLDSIKNAASHVLNGIKFCFTPEPTLSNYFEKTFVNASIRHAGAININLFLDQVSFFDQDMLLQINEGYIELLVKEKTKLLFYNVFKYKTNEDILYYLFCTMEQFLLDPQQVKLTVAGQLQMHDGLAKHLNQYLKNLSFYTPPVNVFDLSGDFETLPVHFYFTLLNQHLCEL